MDLKSICDSSSSSKGKEIVQEYTRREQDLLGRLGQCGGGLEGDKVDCSLRLAPPGRGAAADEPPALGLSSAARAPFSPSSVAPARLLVPQPALAVSEVCTMCAATETPLWRRGPYGPKSLCNACGIRYKKEETRLSLTLGLPSSETKPHREQKPFIKD